jgi:hypothetical protein
MLPRIQLHARLICKEAEVIYHLMTIVFPRDIIYSTFLYLIGVFEPFVEDVCLGYDVHASHLLLTRDLDMHAGCVTLYIIYNCRTCI